MANYCWTAVLALGLIIGGCSAAEQEGTEDASTEAAPDELVRTADPYARGYTDDDFPRIRELATDVYSYEQLRSAGDERFTTVSMFVVTSEGVLVADGQGSVEETQRMIDHIAEITDQPITHVVICSDHGDHTGGNTTFPSDAVFLAHTTSAATLTASANNPNRREGSLSVVLPTEIVDDMTTITLGGKEIEILFLGRAHTGGDLSVHLPAEKILFMSEAYLHRVFPAMRSAFPSDWVAMIEQAQAMDIDYYVPGHGFVDSPDVLEEELETYRQALVTVIAEATRMHGEELSLEDAQAQAEVGDLDTWSLSSSQKARSIQQVYAELNGELPGESN